MDKEQRLVAKIIRETQENKIKWETARQPSSLSGTERLIDYPFRTVINNKVFRIYKYESKYWVDEDRFEWTSNYRLEIADAYSDKSIYAFPEFNSLSDLYTEASRQAAGIDSFLDDYLSDSKE